MKVICLEEEAFYLLVEEVTLRLKEKYYETPDKWINDEEAMRLLNIKSKSTLQLIRDSGRVRFSQPQKKIILYDRDSIMQYLDKHAKETF